MNKQVKFLNEQVIAPLCNINLELASSAISAIIAASGAQIEHIENKEIPKKKREPKPGEIIWVMKHSENRWLPRVFICMDRGNAQCYADGYSNGAVATWTQWQTTVTYAEDPNMTEES